MRIKYHHLLLNLRDAPERVRCVFSDLTAKDLEDKFPMPCRQGQLTLAGTEVIDTMGIVSAKIVATNRLSDVELHDIRQKSWREVEDFNWSSGSSALISAGRGHELEDIEEAGVDVTARFISLPTGQERSQLVGRILNDNWVFTIFGGVIVAGIVFLLGG